MTSRGKFKQTRVQQEIKRMTSHEERKTCYYLGTCKSALSTLFNQIQLVLSPNKVNILVVVFLNYQSVVVSSKGDPHTEVCHGRHTHMKIKYLLYIATKSKKKQIYCPTES